MNVLGVIYLDFIFKILHHSDLLEGYCFISRDYRVITVCQQWFITCKTKEYIPDYPNNEQNWIKFLILLFKHWVARDIWYVCWRHKVHKTLCCCEMRSEVIWVTWRTHTAKICSSTAQIWSQPVQRNKYHHKNQCKQ